MKKKKEVRKERGRGMRQGKKRREKRETKERNIEDKQRVKKKGHLNDEKM